MTEEFPLIFSSLLPMRSLSLLLLALSCCTASHAQNIFHSELSQATSIVQQRRGGFVVIRIAYFKQEALRYLQERSSHLDAPQSAIWLDDQAYHLSCFLYLYRQLLCQSEQSYSEREWLLNTFRQATFDHPIFEDEKDTRSQQFVQDQTQHITPFSLDTDWKKAFAQVSRQLQASSYAQLTDTILSQSPQ